MTEPAIHPEISAMMLKAREWLFHEHSLFRGFDVKPVLIGKGQTRFSVILPTEFRRADGKIHTGLLTTLMDTICGITALTALEQLKPVATINLRTDYMQDVEPESRVTCAANCIAIRNEIATMTSDIRREDNDDLIATASGAFLVGTRGATKASRL